MHSERCFRPWQTIRLAAGVVTAAAALLSPLRAQSVFPIRPDDARAVELTGEAFGASADGVSDDAGALQAAINRVQETTRTGVVLIRRGATGSAGRCASGRASA